jgi:hypothetical protein
MAYIVHPHDVHITMIISSKTFPERSAPTIGKCETDERRLLSTRIVSDIRTALYPRIETEDVIRNCDTLA